MEDSDRPYGAAVPPPLADELRMEPAYPLASPWVRLGATLIDALLFGLALMPGLVVGYAMGGTDLSAPGFALMGLGFLVFLGYNGYLLTTRGQTVGKQLLKLRIVGVDTYENPGFVRAVLIRSIATGFIGNLPLVGNVFSLVDVLFIFSAEHRCIHDHMARTVVVSEAEAADWS